MIERDRVSLKFKKLHQDFKLPTQADKGSSGFDMIACIDQPLIIQPGHRAKVSLGCAVQIPEGYELQVRPRSGLALKEGLTVLNSPGTIDSSYRGEVAAIIINLGQQWFTIHPLDRICQIIATAVPEVVAELVDELDSTQRGTGGFGSSGVKS